MLPWDQLLESPEIALYDREGRELTGRGYKRQPVSWPDDRVMFGQAEGDWGEVAYWGLIDNGELVMKELFSMSKYICRGDTLCATFGHAEPPRTPPPPPYWDDGDGYRDYYNDEVQPRTEWWPCAYCGALMPEARAQCTQCGGWREL